MSVKNIFFDLDYTLWDFKNNSREALCEIIDDEKLGEKYGIQKEDFLEAYNEVNNRLWALYEGGRLEKDVLRWMRFSETLGRFGVTGTTGRTLGAFMGERYVELSPKKTGLFPDALAVLEKLGEKYKIYIITNGFSETQQIKIKNSGISPFVDALITSEEAGAKKPSVQIFDYALNRYGLKADECSITGDDMAADVSGGLNAGFSSAFWFNPENAAAHGKPDRAVEIKKLDELLRYFK